MADRPDGPAEAVRQAVFTALVTAQDEGLAPAASRLKVAAAFGIHIDMVRDIEREGLEKDWPPL